MKRFMFGLLLGLILGTVVTVTAHTRGGFMTGWDVTQRGHFMCSDPYVNPAAKEIECD